MSLLLVSERSVPYELYSSNWAVFLPSIIVDAKLGCLWQLELQIDCLANLITDKLKRVEFLLFRESDAKVVLLRHLTDYLYQPSDYPTLFKIFHLLNAKLKTIVSKSDNGESKKTVFLDQSEIFRYLLLPLSNSKEVSPSNIITILVEFLKSLIAHHLEPQYFIHELVVNSLVQFRMFHLLRLLVENGVFSDSKPFACLLLSLENIFPPAYQMALDMLKVFFYLLLFNFREKKFNTEG
jgi:regulator of MON1-CCZ1 complex